MNERKNQLKHLDFILADFAILQLSWLLGNCIWAWVNGSRGPEFGTLYRHQAILLLLCVALSLLIGTPYKNILKRNKYQEITSSARHTMNLLILYIFLIFFTHEGGAVSRLTVVYTWLIYFVADTSFRLLWKRILRHRLLSGTGRAGNAMILLADSGRAEEIIRGLQVASWTPYFIKAVFLTDYDRFSRTATDWNEFRSSDKNIMVAAPVIADLPVLGGIQDAVHYAANHWVDEVMIGFADRPADARETEQHFEKMGITTHRILLRIPDSWQAGTEGVEKYGAFMVSTHVLRNVPLWQWGVKRLFDIIGAVVGMAVTGVIFLFVAPQIYHADKGPVIYTSIRIGRNGRPFRFYKFRSMYRDADKRKRELMEQNKMQGLMFKVDDDPRILPGIGQFIRRTSLDEFPQFWNVLKGDMSLVGTRPPTQDEWEQYGEEHRIRMTQRPGITGIWQVSGRSSVTDFSEVVKMDERYIETWTIGMDFVIILKTIGKVFRKEGAE